MAKVKDRTGQKFGRLTAQQYCGVGDNGAIWECLCNCGKVVKVQGSLLARGTTKSCGCLGRESRLKHGRVRTPEYRAWCAAKTRCYDVALPKYPRYGGRGIAMCERWKSSFPTFFRDMGKRPSKKHSLDRINNDGNYEPGNCRWATRKQQAINKTHGRTRRKLTDQQVDEIKVQLESGGLKFVDIAVLYGVSKYAIADIARGKTWKQEHKKRVR